MAAFRGFRLKDGIGPEEVLEYFKAASAVIAAAERHEAPARALVDRYRRLRNRVSEYLGRPS